MLLGYYVSLDFIFFLTNSLRPQSTLISNIMNVIVRRHNSLKKHAIKHLVARNTNGCIRRLIKIIKKAIMKIRDYVTFKYDVRGTVLCQNINMLVKIISSTYAACKNPGVMSRFEKTLSEARIIVPMGIRALNRHSSRQVWHVNLTREALKSNRRARMGSSNYSI